MCVCVYVCVDVCVHVVYMCMRVRVCICMCMYTCTYGYLSAVIHCEALPQKEFGSWVPNGKNVPTQMKLECWDNATLVNTSSNNTTCLLSGEWSNDPNSLCCRRKLLPCNYLIHSISGPLLSVISSEDNALLKYNDYYYSEGMSPITDATSHGLEYRRSFLPRSRPSRMSPISSTVRASFLLNLYFYRRVESQRDRDTRNKLRL